MRELGSDEVIARKHKEALFHHKTEGKPRTGFVSSSSADCSDKSVEMSLHSASGFRNFFSMWGPCDVNFKKNMFFFFVQNCATSEPGCLVHMMMSWFHRGSTSSSRFDVWSSSTMMTSEWGDPAALASLPTDQFTTSPRCSSSLLYIAPRYRHGS